ncbi:MAG: hypothetical protein ACEY3B_06385 [Wolbachia sp.]
MPVSRTGMTSFIMQHRVTLQRSYSCELDPSVTHWDDKNNLHLDDKDEVHLDDN